MPEAAVSAIVIGPGDPEEPLVADLLQRSEAYARSLYPSESVHMLPVALLRAADVRFLVARDRRTGDALGCGAVVLQSGAAGEIKRMFVDEGARGQGIGGRILEMLERIALAEGARVLRLETGVSQPEALALYRRSGYVERGPFGKYHEDPLSIFMEKRLDC